MRVYIAASFPMKAKAKEVKDYLMSQGIEVIASWIDLEQELVSDEAKKNYALLDFQEVSGSDALVFINGAGTRGGKHVEMGMALGAGKPVYVLGTDFENVFHYLFQWPMDLNKWKYMTETQPVQHFEHLDMLARKMLKDHETEGIGRV